MNVMIVDDEEDLRVLMRTILELANHGLVADGEAVDGEEAVEVWREHRPDCILMDHRMPRLTGIEAAKQILEEDPDQRIVLVTAYENAELRRQASAVGVRAVLAKDGDLFERIPEALWSLG